MPYLMRMKMPPDNRNLSNREQAELDRDFNTFSGEVFIVFEPNWFINDFDGLVVASTHGSPWKYDTYVPIVFAGAGLTPAVIDRKVATVDVAATLAAFLGLKPPSGAAGDPLIEVLAR